MAWTVPGGRHTLSGQDDQDECYEQTRKITLMK